MARVDNSGPEYETATIADALSSTERRSDVLIIGPTLSNKDEIAFDLLAESWNEETAPFAVTAADSEQILRSRFREFVPRGRSAAEFYVIDCSESSDAESESACSVASPADLTGVGICLSKGYDRHGTDGDRRVLIDNLSTLLIYSDVGRIYRFLSVINSRIAEVGDATVQLLDVDAVSSEDKNKLFQLFSTVVQVQTEAGTMLFRIRGDTNTEWYEYQRLERENE